MNALQQAVINQLGYDSLDEDCIATLEDVSSHGANVGFNGFIYYTETEEFYTKNKSIILDALQEMVDKVGFDGVMALVKQLKCAENSTEEEIAQTLYSDEVDTYVVNCLAWFALESVAYELVDKCS